MTSSRLPGKVMLPLADKPVIDHIVEGARLCKNVDDVIVATSKEKSDDPLADYCIENNIECYRGDLDNVLSRFVNILKSYNFDYFVRITGDCPLIYPPFIDAQIKAIKKFDGDLLWSEKESSVLEGQGVHSTRSLFKVFNNTTDQNDFEHVGSVFFISHPDQFKIVEMKIPGIFYEYDFRLTLDEKNDYKLLSTIYENLWKSKPLELLEVLLWLDNNPEIARINRTVKHKQLNRDIQEKKRKHWLSVPKIGFYRWEIT
tara:strand:- start:586 stop:1359 length:774 start_codon:yes stop_codon:yes gene_type:complete